MIPSRSLSWIVWFIASAFYAYQYVIRVLPNILMPEIMQKFQIDASLFGQFSSIYYIGYTLVHLPIGLMLDRIGPKFVIPTCMALTGAGLLPIVYADQWMFPILGRLLIGIGSSGAILGVFKITRMCFPEERFTVMLGISVTIGLIGAIYGGQPVNALLGAFGWESVLQFICYIGLGLAVISYFIIPKIKKPKKETGIFEDLKTVFANPMVLLVCVLGGLMVGPLEGFADAWSTEFFKTVYGAGEDVAASLPSLIFLGMGFGAPVLSYIAAKTHGYYQTTIVAALLMMASFIAFMYFQIPLTFVSAVLLLTGFLCGYQILVIYKSTTYVHKNLVGITTSFANMVIMIFGSFFHTIVGGSMDFYWDGAMEGARRIYSPEAFINSLSVIPTALGVAAVGFMGIMVYEKIKGSKARVHRDL